MNTLALEIKTGFQFHRNFSRGLAPDSGLFIPSDLKKYTNNELKNLKNLSYVDLATEIISNFCSSDLKKKN